MKILAKRKVRRGFACVILRFWVFHKLKIRHQSFKKLGFGFSTFSESICLIRFWIFHILKTQNLSLPKPHRFWVLLLLGVLGFMLTPQIQKYGPRHQKFSHCLNLSTRLSLKRLSSFEVGTFRAVYGTKARNFSWIENK